MPVSLHVRRMHCLPNVHHRDPLTPVLPPEHPRMPTLHNNSVSLRSLHRLNDATWIIGRRRIRMR
jgi:hypothetical protein